MEKTESAEYVDEYFLGRIRWVTLVPSRQPKYKAHRGLGAACSALGYRGEYFFRGNKKICKVEKGCKLFYASNKQGFLEVEVPDQFEGSLTEYLTPIINKQLGEL